MLGEMIFLETILKQGVWTWWP